MIQGKRNRGRLEHGGNVVADRNAHKNGWIVPAALCPLDTGHCLEDGIRTWSVSIRTSVAESGHTDVDEPWIDAPQRFVVDAEALDDTGAVVLDQNVCPLGESMHDLLP